MLVRPLQDWRLERLGNLVNFKPKTKEYILKIDQE
jgi:hypothetical protein